MSLTLYEIDERLRQALEAVYMDEKTGELHGMEAVELLEMVKEDKLLAIGKYYKGFEAEYEAVKAEADKLAARAKSMKTKLNSLHSKMFSQLKPDQVIKDAQCEIKLHKCPPSVRILDEKLLPPGLMRTKTTTEPDKISICEVLKGGNAVPGAELVTNYSLQIR